MNTIERVKFLKLKIEKFKDQLTAFETFVTNFDRDTLNVFELQHRSNNLSFNFNNLDDVIIELISLEEKSFPTADRNAIENRYYSNFAEAQKIIKGVEQRAHSTQIEASLNQSNLLNDSISNTKFPTKTIPTFSGNYEEFVSFKNRFKSMIDSKKNLSNLDKFDYLCSALQNDAKHKLTAIASETAYEDSWKNLEKAYGSKRILTSHHLNKFLALPKIEKENYKSIIDLADKALQHVEALKSLNLEIPSEALVVILENKLDSYTLELWDKEMNADELPKLDKFTDFLYQLAARFSRRDREKPSISKSFESRPPKMQKFDPESKKALAMVTSSGAQPTCIICNNEQHPLYMCKSFNSISLNDRYNIVKKHKLCFNCLKKRKVNLCKSNGFCKQCKQKHHSLLHGAWTQRSGKDNDLTNKMKHD